MAGSFVDSNVLLYFASADAAKADRVEAIMEAGGTISVQVLNEMAAVMRRKFGFGWEEATAALATVRVAFRIVPLVVETHERGLALAQRYRLGIFDAMIAAAALGAGCDTLWSEDMQDGLVIDRRLTVRNPFAP
jgi:predicted nucleic acid-binding protein